MSSELLNLLALNEEIRDFLADDMVQKLRVPWTESNIVRIGVVNGNDSLIHSVIKSFYKEYNDNNEKTFRESIARDLRVDLAALLDVLVDDNSNMSMYDIINNSIYKTLGERGIEITNRFGTKTGFILYLCFVYVRC